MSFATKRFPTIIKDFINCWANTCLIGKKEKGVWKYQQYKTEFSTSGQASVPGYPGANRRAARKLGHSHFPLTLALSRQGRGDFRGSPARGEGILLSRSAASCDLLMERVCGGCPGTDARPYTKSQNRKKRSPYLVVNAFFAPAASPSFPFVLTTTLLRFFFAPQARSLENNQGTAD